MDPLRTWGKLYTVASSTTTTTTGGKDGPTIAVESTGREGTLRVTI